MNIIGLNLATGTHGFAVPVIAIVSETKNWFNHSGVGTDRASQPEVVRATELIGIFSSVSPLFLQFLQNLI